MATVLLVDDDPAVLAPLQLLFEADGFRVSTAHDGQAAMSSVGRSRPDVIVTDLTMPGIDGAELCRRLKANPTTACIPVVMLTAAFPRALNGARCWNALLTKPASFIDLRRAVSLALSETAGASTLHACVTDTQQADR
jgi:CheY-like chemotaxis protein